MGENNISARVADPICTETQIAVWEILNALDKDFVPPLSLRKSTTDMGLKDNSGDIDTESSLKRYFYSVLQQHIIMACVNSKDAGLMTFRHNYFESLISDYCPCNYITTIGVSPAYRKMGVARILYQFILQRLPRELRCKYVVTRTWSSNNGHIHLLDEHGFNLIETLRNHRGLGIDTVYYAHLNRT